MKQESMSNRFIHKASSFIKLASVLRRDDRYPHSFFTNGN